MTRWSFFLGCACLFFPGSLAAQKAARPSKSPPRAMQRGEVVEPVQAQPLRPEPVAADAEQADPPQNERPATGTAEDDPNGAPGPDGSIPIGPGSGEGGGESVVTPTRAEVPTTVQKEAVERVLETKTVDQIEEITRIASKNMCPEVCRSDQACVHGRCLHACTPECRPGTTCQPNGTCLAPPVVRDFKTEDELARIAGAQSADAKQAYLLDPGGIFFLGAQLAYERGGRSAWIARLQLMNTGLMSYSLEPQNEFERFEFGFGTSIGYRRYEAAFGNLRGFFYGGGALFQILQVVDDRRDDVTRTSYMTGPYGEFGYRWVFGSFLFGFGPNISLRVPVAHGFAARGPDSCVADGTCPSPAAARFEGTLQLEVGWLQ